jgi:hypothetical protein
MKDNGKQKMVERRRMDNEQSFRSSLQENTFVHSPSWPNQERVKQNKKGKSMESVNPPPTANAKR